MHTVWVTGSSGAGKSAVSRRLAALGHEAVSTDGTDGLCHWVDRTGGTVERPAAPDLAWLETHQWRWRPARLDQLLEAARGRGVEVLFLCGDAANALALAAGRFDRTVLLRITLDTLRSRLADPTRGNDFGRVGQSRDQLIANFDKWQRYLERHVDVVVDATADLDTVTAEVLRAAQPPGRLAPHVP